MRNIRTFVPAKINLARVDVMMGESRRPKRS